MKRKLLSLLLAAVMVCSLLPATALAAEEDYSALLYENGTVYRQLAEGKAELTAEELAGLNGVSLHGISAFNGKIFPTMKAAYDAVSEELAKAENGGLEQTGLDDEAFSALYTDVLPDEDDHDGVTLTWTIFGDVEWGTDLGLYYLSGGRAAAWYGSDARTIRCINVVGFDENARLTVKKNPTMPYQWWGDSTDMYVGISFKGLTINDEVYSEENGTWPGFSVSCPYNGSFDLSMTDCTFNGTLYHYFNGDGRVTIDNCVFNGTLESRTATNAFMAQGHESEPLEITFTNNVVSGYVRGINIDQVTAKATITGNTITPGVGYSAIQLAGFAQATVENNTIYNQGDFLTFHENIAKNADAVSGRTVTIKGNNIYAVEGVQGYLIYDDITASGNYGDNSYFTMNWENNTVDETIITSQGIKGENVYGLSTSLGQVVARAAEVDGVTYPTIQAAAEAAADGAVITVLEDQVLNEKLNLHYPDKSLTIQGAEGKDITISGGADLADQTLLSGTLSGLTLKNLAFNNGVVKSLTTTGPMVVEGCTFADTVRNQGDKSGVLNVSGSGDSATLTVTGSTFRSLKLDEAATGAEFVGLYTNGTWASITVQDSVFDEIAGTALSLRGSDSIAVTNNEISNWASGSHEDAGRAIRVDFGSRTGEQSLVMNGNKLTAGENAKESYAKIGEISGENAENVTLNVEKNYWSGKNPVTGVVSEGNPVLEIVVKSGDEETVLTPDRMAEDPMVEGEEVYYLRDTMKDSDLSTYVPSTGGSSVTRYEVAVAETENGTVTVSPQRAARGRTVTITATPDKGYEVASVTVVDADGSAVEVTDKGNGKFTFTMPRGKVSVEVTFQPAEEESEPQPEGLPFTDVAEGDWYYDAVAYAWENDLMTGTSATLFAPNVTTTRAMLATLLYRLEGSPDLSNEILGYPYADVEADSWYGDAVYWARLNGVVTGITAETFDPNGNITREQMAVMLYRYADYKGYDITQGGMAAREYEDYETVSSWAVSAVDWAVNAGLISGTSATTLTPQGSATRAEIATILMRFVETFVPAE